MAIWQVYLKLSTNRDSDAAVLRADRIEQIGDTFLALFGKPVNDIEGVFVWGNLESDCIIMTRTESGCAEIVVRVDIRTLNLEFLDRLRSICSDNDLFLHSKGYNVPLERESILKILRHSNAAKYIDNPELFLDNCE